MSSGFSLMALHERVEGALKSNDWSFVFDALRGYERTLNPFIVSYHANLLAQEVRLAMERKNDVQKDGDYAIFPSFIHRDFDLMLKDDGWEWYADEDYVLVPWIVTIWMNKLFEKRFIPPSPRAPRRHVKIEKIKHRH